MSIFGEPLPHEDDTATSLIRREGYPPLGSYDQMPQVYVCPCCSAINPSHERDHLLRTAKEEKELERRRIMQLDIFDERAKPVSTAAPRPRSLNIQRDPDDDELNQPVVPPPPMTLDELRKMRQEANKTRLIVTVHHGKNLNAHPHDPTSILVRCGAFEGQTAKVPRGSGSMCTWEELFEFPYPNEEEPLEVLVIDDELPAEQDHILGGIVVPPYALRNRARGDEDVLPVCPEDEMHRGYGRMKETPLGSIVVSWYVKYDGQEAEPTDGKQNLESPVDCVFVVHRVFQYTDNGTTPFTGGVLCVLRDTDDNCSASTQYQPSGVASMSTSPYYTKDGFNYLPEPSSQIMQLITEKRLGHVLVCVPKNEGEGEDDEELLVVGAVPLDFGELYRKGSAVLLVESKVKEDVLWGEIALEWSLTPHADVQRKLEELQLAEERKLEHDALKEREMPTTSESLFVTVVRGLNLADRNLKTLDQAQVSVFAGDMEGSTFVAPMEVGEDGVTSVMNWNQEVRFMEVDGNQSDIKVYVLDDGQRVSSGSFTVDTDRGYAVVKMHDLYDEEKQLGELLVTYNRLCNTGDDTSRLSGKQNGSANKMNGNGTQRSSPQRSERSPRSRSHQYSNDGSYQNNENRGNNNALEGYEEYDNMHEAGKHHSEEEHSGSRARERGYSGGKQDSNKENSASRSRKRSHPGEGQESGEELSGRRARERGYPVEGQDYNKEHSGRRGQDSKKENSPGRSRERSYPGAGQDSGEELSGRRAREQGYLGGRQDSNKENSASRSRKRSHPGEGQESGEELSGRRARERGYPVEGQDSNKEHSGRRGQDSKKENSPGRSRERSYPGAGQDSGEELSGRRAREQGYLGGRQDSNKENSASRSRERSHPGEGQDSNKERSGRQGQERGHPVEGHDSKEEQPRSRALEQGYPVEGQDSKKERSGRQGQDSKKENSPGRSRERSYPGEGQDSKKERSGRQGQERGHPVEGHDSKEEQPRSRALEQGYPVEGHDSKEEQPRSRALEQGYPVEGQDSKKERSGRQGQDSKKENSPGRSRERSYPEEGQDSKKERSGRQGQERGHPVEGHDSKEEQPRSRALEQGYPVEGQDSKKERSGRQGQDSKKENSPGRSRERSYPEEGQDSKKERSGRQGQDSKKENSPGRSRERGHPGEGQDSKKEQPRSRALEQGYPEEDVKNAGAEDDLGRDVVRRESEKREPMQHEYPREEDEELNPYDDPPQEYVGERMLKSGHGDNAEVPEYVERNEPEVAGHQQQEGMTAQNIAASSKPPRAVRTTLMSERHRSPRGTSPFNGAGSASVPSQSHSTPHSDWSQGEAGCKPRGTTSRVGKRSGRREQLTVPKVPTVRQPWFPAGSTGNEEHIPLEKRESFINRTDSIRHLELRSRASERGSGRHVSRQSTGHD